MTTDRERVRRKYGDGLIRRCLNERNGVHYNELFWSLGFPIGHDSYLYREAVLCGERCFVEYFDDHPELVKPAAYQLIQLVPEDQRPEPDRISEFPVGDAGLLDRLIKGAGHRHAPDIPCDNCAFA